METGESKFEITDTGDLVNSADNVVSLRQLLLDRSKIKGDDLGPGDPGDFDNGAWHVACHVAAGCGVRRRADGSLVWLEISHDRRTDRYFASATVHEGGGTRTVSIDSAEGRLLLQQSNLIGFVEGTSRGRISARCANDLPGLFNRSRRQDYDQPTGMTADGGRVWEHWCVQRDIRSSNPTGTSMLNALITLAANLGAIFIPIIARGRREYNHPGQLREMVRVGLVPRKAALWEGTPLAIPSNCEHMLEHSDPATSLHVAEMLDWSSPPRYYMFARKITGWSRAAEVEKDLSS